MKRVGTIVIAPILCLGMLLGMVAEQRTRLKPEDAEPYHARAKAIIEAMPRSVDVDGVRWTAISREIPRAAVQLLDPNVMISLHFTESSTTPFAQSADLLIVQCRDSRDMTGHYPPICYPNSGNKLVSEEAREPIQIDGMAIPFMEYHFEKDALGSSIRFCVYNFFIVPGLGPVRDIKGVNDAAEDYQRRFLGAAQFQVLMESRLPRSQRDRIFAALLGGNHGMFETLNSVGIQ